MSNSPAYREKEFGIWQTWTWAQAWDQAESVWRLGLMDLGVNRGDFIAIIGRNRPKPLHVHGCCRNGGGVPVPLYQDAVAEEMAYVLGHCGARFVIVNDQEQVDKVLEVQDQLSEFWLHDLFGSARHAEIRPHTAARL